MKALVFLCFVALANSALGGLEKYSNLVKADPSPTISAPPGRGVRITYLGTNAYLFETRGATLLVDPYFPQQNLFRMASPARTGFVFLPLTDFPAVWMGFGQLQ